MYLLLLSYLFLFSVFHGSPLEEPLDNLLPLQAIIGTSDSEVVHQEEWQLGIELDDCAGAAFSRRWLVHHRGDQISEETLRVSEDVVHELSLCLSSFSCWSTHRVAETHLYGGSEHLQKLGVS